MKPLLALLAAVMLASCGEAPAPQPNSPALQAVAAVASAAWIPPAQLSAGPIPREFRHVWAIAPTDCTAEPGLTRIAIAPGAVRFYEGRSAVQTVDAPQAGAAVLQVEHASKGHTSLETHMLSLDETKMRLTYQRRGKTFAYGRCD
jgi:hypothetical protein